MCAEINKQIVPAPATYLQIEIFFTDQTRKKEQTNDMLSCYVPIGIESFQSYVQYHK